MKLSLVINGIHSNLELISGGPACRFRFDEGPDRSADVESPEPGVYSILIDGYSYDARVEESPAGLVVVIDGYRFAIEVRDPRRWSRTSGAAGAEGVQSIAAPMPGKVVRVLIEQGQTVESGQGLIVVEAMKMQNELKAPRPGRVLSIAARPGATIAAGEVLATIG